MSLAKAWQRSRALLTPRTSSSDISSVSAGWDVGAASEGDFYRVPKDKLFPKAEGVDCDHDCATCEVQLPRGFKIEEDSDLYGSVKGFATHVIVATGKSDWIKHAEDEKGSVMQAIEKSGLHPTNGRIKVSASNMPLPEECHTSEAPAERHTRVLLLPSFIYIDNVAVSNVKQLINEYISPAPATTTLLVPKIPHGAVTPPFHLDNNDHSLDPAIQSLNPATHSHDSSTHSQTLTATHDSTALPPTPQLRTTSCPHKYLILLCSHRSRDVRCGQSAPILRREFERQLRPLGLYRDFRDERPGGCGIYFVSHVSGHKWSANVLIYRRAEDENGSLGEAKQLIFLGRVRPEECEGVVEHTLLKGEVVRPERQLRGGFDRERGVLSW